MGGSSPNTRDITRKLSKIRFTQDLVRVEDFLSEDFRPEDILDRVSLISGIPTVQDNRSRPSNSDKGDAKDRVSSSNHASPTKRLEGGYSENTEKVVQRLLETCTGMVSRLEELQEYVSQESDSLRLALSADHAGYSSRIGTTERNLNQLQESVNSLEKQADDLLAFGQNVGTPFAELQNQRDKASNLADILDHLTIFSHCQDLSMLPYPFHNDDDIENSARAVQALMAAIQSVADIEPRPKKELSSYGHTNEREQQGTLGAAWEQLILYLNVLDNRIVSHFDNAADSKDITAMAYYKRVMDEAHGEFSNGSLLLISRYISRKQIFSSPEQLIGTLNLSREIEHKIPEEVAIHGGFDSTTHVEASRNVSYICNHLLEQIREEIFILEQIFGEDSGKAVSMFVSRVFEETLSDAVSRIFSTACFGKESTSNQCRESLRLLCESYRKVHNLADETCHVVSLKGGKDMPIQEMVDSAMGDLVANYPDLERRWHQSLGSVTVNSKTLLSEDHLKKDIVLNLISMNEESVNRCLQVMPVNQRSQFIQDLFFCRSQVTGEQNLASLLDCVGKYLMEHLEKLEKQAQTQIDNHTLWKDTTIDSQSIKSTVNLSFGAIGNAAVSVSELIRCVKEHYWKNVAPLLPPEEQDPWKALLGLQIGIEDHLAMIMQAVIQNLISKIDNLLHATQVKSHFLCDGSNTEEIELPTPPCLKVCAILYEILALTKTYLVSNNYISFVQVLSNNLGDTLESHFLKFYFTQAGALRLKQDIKAYSSCIAASNVPSAIRYFDNLAAMSNILVVGSLSVHEMVESVSYLGQGRVDSFRQRRFEK